MFDLSRFLLHAGIYILLATIPLLTMMYYDPRMVMQDYPPPIKALVPPKTGREKRLALLFGLPFLLVLLIYPLYAAFDYQAQAGGGAGFLPLLLYAFGITFAFNLWDWLILDWLLFCTLTPRFLVLPGTEGHPAYKDYAFHFRAFLIGMVFCLLMGLVTAAAVLLFG